MSRMLSLIAGSALALAVSVPAHCQDSPSLADIARQAQKDKANKPPAKVITNDDIPPTSGGVSSGPAASLAPAARPAAANKTAVTGAISSHAEGFEKLQTMLDEIDSLDRATLASNALQGNTASFPGRAEWEQKLFAAKQTFVAQGRATLQRAEQITDSAVALRDVQDPDDKRVKAVISKLQQLEKDNDRNTAAFQDVIQEGRNLAAQASGH